MFQDTEMFVPVASCLAYDLTMDGLGCDPTASFVLSDEETEWLSGNNEDPSAIVSSSGHNQRLCTIGLHVATRTPLSLLGRGTHVSVWLVRESVAGDSKNFSSLNGDEMIMKTARWNSGRTPKFKIYSSIHPPISGLANFECGSDVKFSGDNIKFPGVPITVQNLRSAPHDRNDYDSEGANFRDTPILYRLILNTVGCPLWTYMTDLDLLTGFRDAIQTHQHLCNAGILHRDVSAGNVLLGKTKFAPFRGFITDLDFSHMEKMTIQQPEVTTLTSVVRQHRYLSPEPMTRTHQVSGMKVPVKHDANINGTIQFMSAALLLQAEDGVNRKFVHEAKDDVESFIWVLSYCVMRNLYYRASHEEAPEEVQVSLEKFRTLFRRAFGQATVSDLINGRHYRAIALRFATHGYVQEITAAFMSEALISLFKEIQDLLFYDDSPKDPILLTHDSLLEKVNDAIAKLEA